MNALFPDAPVMMPGTLRRPYRLLILLVFALVVSTPAVQAQDREAAPQGLTPDQVANGLTSEQIDSPAQTLAKPAVFDGVGVTEKLGDSIPLSLNFRNEQGEEVALADYFQSGRPVILNFVYYNCPMLCSVLLESFTKSMKEMEWTAGSQFDVLTISFSATETPELASSQKIRYLETLGRPEAAEGWHFMTGSQENIFQLADAVGFGFKWVEETQDYAHPAALIFLSGEGKVTRYIHGMNYPPKDLRKALVEASQGKVGSAVDKIFLYCYRYDPTSNSYVLHAMSLMKIGGGLTLLVVLIGLFIFWRRERSHLDRGLSPRESVALQQ
jgi:protein SCO1/2